MHNLWMHALVADKLPGLRDGCRKHGVKRLDLFGSAASDQFDPARSDLDFLVEFDPAPPGQRADQYFGLLFDLERLFDRRIDLAETGAFRNPHVLQAVERTRTPVYVAA